MRTLLLFPLLLASAFAAVIQPGTYAKLTPDRLSVEEIRVITAAVDADTTRIKPVVMTAQPAFNAATQRCVQNGWTVNATNVTPVWLVVALTAAELNAIEWRNSEIALKAVAAVTAEEINNIRQWLADFKAQVALASTLADLKTRVAALPNMPQRTLTQVRTAIANKIDAGTVD
jgi:hypothetical protein